MAGFLKKIFSFGKKEVIETPVEDEALAPINWDALKELKREEAPAVAEAAPVLPEPMAPEPPVPELPVELPPEPVLPEEAPGPIVPDETPELPVEVPAEPVPPSRPEPEIPPAPRPEKPKKAPVEVPPAPAPPAEPERPVEAPVEPEIPSEVPVEPAVPSRPEPEIPSAPEPEVPPAPRPEKPTKAPVEAPPAPEPPAKPERPVEIPAEPVEVPPAQPGALPPTPLRGGSVHERSEMDRGGGEEPIAGAPIATALEPHAPSLADLPPPRTALPSDPPHKGEGGRTPTDPEALAPIDWEGLKAFRRQDEPPPPPEPSSKVTVSKKVEQKKAPTPPSPSEPKLTWYQRLRQGLARSSRELSGNIAGIFTKRKLDEDTLQDLEDVLIRADLGVETAMRVTDTLASTRYGKEISDQEVRAVMATEVEKVLTPVAQALELDLSHKPHVILVVGVNGTGKTTTIGKLAAKLKEGGLSVMLAAGDTFRAAAIEQLKIWGERTDSPVVSSKLGADAAGLAFDAFVQAKEEGSDVLIIDTAGRLQNKAELMAELEKIVRVLGKHDPEAPHTVLQTVDATTGQNALNQVEIFRNVAGVNGLVMTKLDGTARGGILVAIAAKYKLPVYFIGVGEQVDDLEPFSAGDFAKAIAGVG
jgi:fused signal recognition particle receptor